MSKRAGGRQARLAARAAPLPEHIKPVRAGLAGGRFQVLSATDIDRIHEGAMTLLEEVGLADAPQSGIDYLCAAGANYGEDRRIRIPRALVGHMLTLAAKDVTLSGQDPKHDLNLSGKRVHYGTAGAAVHVVDSEGRVYRESNLRDLYDAGRIVQTLDNIHFFQRPIVARDMQSGRDLDINTLYASVSATTKHVGTSFVSSSNVVESLAMLHLIAGSEAAWRARPFVSQSNCFVVPPLRFASESCEMMESAILGGMPVLLLSAGQAGATAPATIAGAVTQATAECLAGMVYVNAVSPGHPAIFGTWPFVSDLRSGAMSGGSGEQALLTSACAQMAQYYGLPAGSAAGMADSKMPDMQAGYEHAISNVMAGLTGLNMVYEAAGMHASLLGFSFDSLIIDNDIIGQCLRCVRGIEVSDDSLAIETIRQVCLEGPGHYLGHDQTLAVMQSEYIYPEMGDRTSPKEWEEVGRPELIDRVIERRNYLLATHFPGHISEQLDRQIRDRFNIKLPREVMRPAAEQ